MANSDAAGAARAAAETAGGSRMVTINSSGNPNPNPANISQSGNGGKPTTITFQTTAGDDTTYNISGLSAILNVPEDPVQVGPGISAGPFSLVSNISTGLHNYTVTVASPYTGPGPGDDQINVEA